MTKVYPCSPFGQKFTSEEELDDLLTTRLFVMINHDRITAERLNEKINGAKGLFYYSFITDSRQKNLPGDENQARTSRDEHYRTPSPSDDKSPRFDRVVRRVQANEDGTLILPPEVPFYFVIYKTLEDRPYFSLADGLSSEAINDAIDLARDIIKGDRVGRILLQSKASNSTVEDVQIEYLDSQIDPMQDKPHFTPENLVDCLFLHTELIDFSTTISSGKTGYQSLVLFLAITLVHESTIDYNNQTESPRSLIFGLSVASGVLEDQILGGVIELEYEVDKPSVFKLKLTSNILEPLTLSSARRNQAPEIPDLTPTVQFQLDRMDMITNIIEEQKPGVENPIVKCNIRLTNKSQRDVELPVDYLPAYTLSLEAYRLFDDGSSHKIYRRPFKPRMMSSFKSSILRIDESRDYCLGLSSLFQFYYGRKYQINIQFKTRIGYSGVPYHFRSNPQSLIVTFGEPVKQTYSHPATTKSLRTSLRLFCQNVKLILVKND